MCRWSWSSTFESSLAWPGACRIGRRAGVRVGGLTVASVETIGDAALTLLDAESAAGLIISHERAAALGLGNRLEAASGDPVAIGREEWMDGAAIRKLGEQAFVGLGFGGPECGCGCASYMRV